MRLYFLYSMISYTNTESLFKQYWIIIMVESPAEKIGPWVPLQNQTPLGCSAIFGGDWRTGEVVWDLARAPQQ
jgi:hypothetical protein